MAACKPKSCSDKRSRKWSDEELKKFAEVLADDYAFDLEALAVKKLSIFLTFFVFLLTNVAVGLGFLFHASILAANIGIFALRITETER